MALKKQHIDHRQLIHISMPLELLPHLRAQRRRRDVERVHGLDLGGRADPLAVAVQDAGFGVEHGEGLAGALGERRGVYDHFEGAD